MSKAPALGKLVWVQASAEQLMPGLADAWFLRAGKHRVGSVLRPKGCPLWAMGAQSWCGSCSGSSQAWFTGVQDLADAQRRVEVAALAAHREEPQAFAGFWTDGYRSLWHHDKRGVRTHVGQLDLLAL